MIITVHCDVEKWRALLRMLAHEHFAYDEEGLKAAMAFDAIETAVREAERREATPEASEASETVAA